MTESPIDSLILRYLVARERGEAEGPDGLFREHPERAAELREVISAFDRLDARLRTLTAGDWSSEATGRGVETDSTKNPDSSWGRLLDQLQSRGPLHARYETKRLIARGGMGAVFLADDLDLRRAVALKVLSDRDDDLAISDDRLLGRFLEEAQITGQLDHPAVVPVHDLGVDEVGRVFFTMKLVRGEEFAAVIQRVHDPADPEWTTSRAAAVLLRVCEAMTYAHAKDVLHRDLKPSNVMVGRFGEVYVMDWGLARVRGAETKDIRPRPADSSTLHVGSDRREISSDAVLTMDGDVVGTPAYMAPEQARGGLELGPAADIYSLGAILYHILCGHMPYVPVGARVSGHAVLGMVLAGPPAPIAREAVDAPGELIAICTKAMDRESTRRYASAEALGLDLRAYLEGRVVRAYEGGAVAEARAWVKRNPALATAAAAAVAGLVLGAVGMAVSAQRAGEAERVAQGERRRASYEAYVGHVAAAWGAFNSADAGRFRMHLAAAPDEYRGWEWQYLAARSDESVEVLTGHQAQVGSVRFSPDETRIVTASHDGTARVWSTDGWSQVCSLEHGSPVLDAEFSPDGRRVLTVCEDGLARIWGASDGNPIRTLQGHTAKVTSARWSPVGDRVGTASADHTARIWDQNGTAVAVLRHEHPVERIEFNTDGSQVVTTAGNDAPQVWDVTGARSLFSLGSARNSQRAFNTAFTPDGLHVAVERARSVELWDVLTGALVHECERPREVEVVLGVQFNRPSLAIDPSGTYVASANGVGRAFAWNVESGAAVGALRTGTGITMGDVALSSDGRLFAGGSAGILRFLDLMSGQATARLGHAGAIVDIAVSRDGSLAVTASEDRTVRVWEAELPDQNRRSSDYVLGAFPSSVQFEKVIWSRDGTRLLTLSASGEPWIWDARTLRPLVALRHPWSDAMAEVSRLATASPAGDRIVTRSENRAMRIWGTAPQRALRERAVMRRQALPEAMTVLDEALERHQDLVRAGEEIHDRALEPWVERAAVELLLERANSIREEAWPLVRDLSKIHEFEEDVRQAVQRQLPGDSWVEREARHIAATLGDDPDRLNRDAWKTVEEVGATRPEAEHALKQAARAYERTSSRQHLNTLGLAQFRCGFFSEARLAFARCITLEAEIGNEASRLDSVCLAMAEWQLGEREAARVRFESVPGPEGWRDRGYAQLYEEARLLIRQ